MNGNRLYRRLVISLVIAGSLLILTGCQGLVGAANGSGTVGVGTGALNFGTVVVGDSKTLADTISNNTSASVTISSIQGLGTAFKITGVTLPVVLAAGQSTPFTVEFQPTVPGTPSATVAFAGTNAQALASLSVSGDAVSVGKLSPSPSPVPFGNTNVGGHQAITVTLANNGGTDLTINQATMSGAGFSMSNLALPLTVSAGKSASATVTFAPTGGGNFSGSVTFATTANDVNSNVVLNLTGDGASPGTLAANPTSLSFGSVQVGSNSTKSETLTNTGGSTVTISQVSVSGTGFSVSGLSLPATLAPNQGITFNAIFAPTTAGSVSGAISITSDASNSPLSVLLSATGLSAGSLSATPSSANFGNVTVGSNQTVPVSVTNTGGEAVTLSSAAASGTGFSFTGPGLPATLNAGQSATFNVVFAPTSAGAASGSLNINSNANNSTLSVPLSGTGVAQGQLGSNPSSFSFGSIQVGTSKSLNGTLTNSGGSSITITAAAASGTGFSLSGLSLPVILNAGQSTTFTVLFSPTTSGTANGGVSITSNGSNSNLSIPLSGTGVTQGALAANPTSLSFGSVQIGNTTSLAETLTNSGGSSITISAATASGTGFSLSGLSLPLTLNAGQSASFTVAFAPTTSGAASGSVGITSNGSNSSLSIPLSGTGLTQGALGANPTSLAFGSVQVNTSKSLTETLTNSGGTSLTISAASASGTGFSLSGLSLPLTLTAGQSTSFSVVFAPTASGVVSGNVSITSNGSDSSLSIPLSGTGITQGTLTANPTSLSFGSIQDGSSSNLSETLTNSGGSSVTITAAAASGAGFSLSGLTLPLTLNAGQTSTFTVVFTPTAGGAANGSVSITSNGSNPNLSIPLTGTGVTPGALSSNPASLGFGNVQVSGSTNLSETLTNTGGSSVTITQASVTGAGFSISGLTLPLTLNSNQSVTFTATFAPTSAGAVSGNLSVLSNASNSTLNIPLSGTGTASGQLAVSPTSLSFGNVVVGSGSSLNGSLTASGATVTVNSASLTNGEFALSGISLPVTLSAGQSATFTVTFTPQATGATSASLSFSSNASNSPAVQTMTGTGTAPVQHTVDLTWTASNDAVGYNIYRSTVSGGPYTMINGSLDSATAYTDSTVAAGQTYYYVATAVNSNSQESAYSTQTQAIVPSP